MLARSTGARAATDADAAAATADAVACLIEAGIDRLYVKIDSTVRGSVAGQVDGALDVWRRHHPHPLAVVCPAFPAVGRTAVDGVVLDHGVPAADGAAGTDPVTPLRTSRLDELLPGADRMLSDAADDAALERLAALIHRTGPAAVAVGSGGLAAALARCWSVGEPQADGAEPADRVLIAVSSLHPATARQLSRLRAAYGPSPVVDVVTGPAARTTPDRAAAQLADRVEAALRSGPVGALVLVGGDGAAAVLDRLGTHRVRIESAVAPGVPLGRVVGGAADGLRLVTKSGGFGDAGTLTHIVDRLTGPAPAAGDSPLARTGPSATEQDTP